MSRRQVLALGSMTFLTAASGVGSTLGTMGKMTRKELPASPMTKTRIGLGGVAIGNGFAPATDEQAEQTLQGSWDAGMRYFDTSPWYGLGLSERRFGHFLHRQKDYVISTKVGRLLSSGPTPKTMWHDPAPMTFRYDYSAAGARRSVEDSLQRLGVEKLDIVFIHDLTKKDHGDKYQAYWDEADKGAMVELARMKKEGLIKHWGFGINAPEAALSALGKHDFDVCLLATQYSLLEHEQCLEQTFPALDKRGVKVVVGAPLNAGYLGGRDRYHYDGKIPPGMPEKRERVRAVCARHGVDMRTAALQFAAAPSLVTSVIPGARTAEQTRANAQSMEVSIPTALWDDLKREGLIAKAAPTPTA